MSQRLPYNTKWLWCLLVMHTSSTWGQPRPITVQTPPSNPSTIEAQAKFFQYRHFPTSEEFNQGHRLGSERHFTERHERAKPSEGLFSAKVRWGDKKGGYGEHYWDLNHAGHSGNQGDDGYDGDDGSYHDSSHNDPYDVPSDHSPTYGNDDYDPEKASYEESGRAKRHHPKVKLVRKHQKQPESDESIPQKDKRKTKEELEAAATHQDEEYDDDDEEEYYEKPKRHHYKKQKENRRQKQEESEANQEQPPPTKEKNQFVLVVSHKDDSEKQQQALQQQNLQQQNLQQQNLQQQNLQQQPQYVQRQYEQPQYLPQQPQLPQYVPKNQPEQTQFVPYEGGAGVRQHQQPEVTAAATVPRLFLEPSTGHVVDRATGQAYVLQPIGAPKTYN